MLCCCGMLSYMSCGTADRFGAQPTQSVVPSKLIPSSRQATSISQRSATAFFRGTAADTSEHGRGTQKGTVAWISRGFVGLQG